MNKFMFWITAVLGAVLSYVFFFLRDSGHADKENKEVTDLTNKIEANKSKASDKQKEADDAYKEYMEALSKYDPNFHNHDDGNNH